MSNNPSGWGQVGGNRNLAPNQQPIPINQGQQNNSYGIGYQPVGQENFRGQ